MDSKINKSAGHISFLYKNIISPTSTWSQYTVSNIGTFYSVYIAGDNIIFLSSLNEEIIIGLYISYLRGAESNKISFLGILLFLLSTSYNVFSYLDFFIAPPFFNLLKIVTFRLFISSSY